MSDYENVELAITALELAEDDLTCFAMHLGKVDFLDKTVKEVKENIGDLRVTKKLLELELGGLRDAGLDNLPKGETQ